MEVKGLVTTLFTAVTLSTVGAQTVVHTPKLVVGITIDQLRADYLELFSSLYGEKGFHRLWKEGRVYTGEYDYSTPDRASSAASIFTGTVPTIHGIVGENWLDPNTLLMKNCVDDRNYMGNYTDENSSAEQLLTSTLGDELKVATEGKGLVYAFSAYREAAILAAGHAADGAFWLDENQGKWCGSTYYSTFPFFISAFNLQEGTDLSIQKMEWKPLRNASDYKYLPSAYASEPFSYRFTDYGATKYRYLKTSPLINDELNRLLRKTFTETKLGRDEVTDLLSVTYYAGPYNHQPETDVALELQDTYVRLDRQLAELLDLIDQQIGLQNAFIFITSTGYTDDEKSTNPKFRIPTGEFYIERSTALLNMYLTAQYGSGQWVEAYDGLQLYLNHKLIEDKKLNLAQIQQQACDFLIQVSGVREVYSASDLLQHAWVPSVRKIRNAYNRNRSGDIQMEVMPGWQIINAKDKSKNHIVRSAVVPAPLIFIGGGIPAAKIEMPVNIDRIAPTISKAIRIRAPNGCTESALF